MPALSVNLMDAGVVGDYLIEPKENWKQETEKEEPGKTSGSVLPGKNVVRLGIAARGTPARPYGAC